MIQDEHIDAGFLQFSDFGDRRRSAVDSNEQLRSMKLATALDAFAAEPVSFFHAQWQK